MAAGAGKKKRGDASMGEEKGGFIIGREAPRGRPREGLIFGREDFWKDAKGGFIFSAPRMLLPPTIG